jgi:hypothetical protein
MRWVGGRDLFLILLRNFEKKELLEKLSPHLDFAFNLVTVFQLLKKKES